MKQSTSVGSDELFAWKAFVSQGGPSLNRESTLGQSKQIMIPDGAAHGGLLPSTKEQPAHENSMIAVKDHDF